MKLSQLNQNHQQRVFRSLNPHCIIIRVFEWTHRHYPGFLDCRPVLVPQAIQDAGFQITNSKIEKMWNSDLIDLGIKNGQIKFKIIGHYWIGGVP